MLEYFGPWAERCQHLRSKKCFRLIHGSEKKHFFQDRLGLRGKKNMRESDLKNNLDPNSQDMEA